MPSSALTLLEIFLALVNIGLFLYTGYISLAIRGALSVRLFRQRALWVAAIGGYFAVFFVFVAALAYLGTVDPDVVRILTGVLAYAGGLAFFVWIDSTIRVARRSDPLKRDGLHWSLLRWFLGFLVIVGTYFGLIFNVSSVAFVQATPLYGPVGLTLLLGGIALLRSATRSNDITLRQHLKWFGVFAILAWATTIVESDVFVKGLGADQGVLQAISYAVFVFSAYSLNRSARSLVPLSSMPASGPAEAQTLGTAAMATARD